MRRIRIYTAALLLLSLLLTSCSLLPEKTPVDELISGTVLSLEGDLLTVTASSGETFTALLGGETEKDAAPEPGDGIRLLTRRETPETEMPWQAVSLTLRKPAVYRAVLRGTVAQLDDALLTLTAEGLDGDPVIDVSAAGELPEDLAPDIEIEITVERKAGGNWTGSSVSVVSVPEEKSISFVPVDRPNPNALTDGAVTRNGFSVTVKNGLTYIGGILIANKTYALPSSYNPGGLTRETQSAFNEMKEAAALDGIGLKIVSGFRSYDTQYSIYWRYVSNDGQAEADTYSARPGHSEHQTGMAMDINSLKSSFAETEEGMWLASHAHEYGFILRYPKGKSSITGYVYEPWHFRYVGKEMAAKVFASGLCLEEYLGIDSEYYD